MSVVVDASMAVALVVADDRQRAARTHFQTWLDAGEELHAPAVLPYEVANVAARRVFGGALELDELAGIWSDLAAIGLSLHPFDFIRDGSEVAVVTARLRRRHATDSSYVCLAMRLETTMFTLDAALARNAAQVGLPVTLVE